MSGADAIVEQAARVRAAGALGRSGLLVRLFDFLVEASAAGARPKEVEIALAVFGRDPGFDGGQDASVRVAVHRLRRKLDAFYAGEGAAEPAILRIPKGEYRLVAEPRSVAARPPGRRRWPWAAAAAALVALNVLVLALVWRGGADPHGPVRRLEPWATLTRSERPLIVVVGDYYIFGDVDPATGGGRLIREYGINSHEDLEAYRMDNPTAAARYRDLDLYYLPVGVAHALQTVVPVLGPSHAPPQLVTASDLTSEMLRRNDIVYLGYLSGLGPLRDPVFAGSRFRVGDTWDELVDQRSGQTFLSQEGGPARGPETQRDYGYLASFAGPEGSRVVVIAGMRDVGLMQAAEAAVRPDVLKAIGGTGAGGVEALFEANGVRRASIAGRLVLSSPLDARRIWSGPPRGATFPAG
ncbi:helix-turn-helix domain-containing protein [Phenylobacterium sp. J367]|uniref:helix-turn-helix domain-containing protein n=1 Tax=Phenylobacterium sp. J367 TaxID=2898435 RepID=UPI0021517C3D|nr:helix-turn-helix domain-containing protein [Phenylobacterium sp. J367]MCR5879349.1 helix-turn-helix domain-containing protein [Phenylobacterium sp. J367]